MNYHRLLHLVIMQSFFTNMAVVYYVVGVILQAALVLGVRFSYRFILLLRSNRQASLDDGELSSIFLDIVEQCALRQSSNLHPSHFSTSSFFSSAFFESIVFL